MRAITIEARRLNPNLYIVARTRFVTEVAPLRRLGANDVIAEEFETSIEVFSRVLTQYLIPRQDIDAFAARIRQMNYRMIRRMSNAVDPLDEVVSRLPDMGVQAMRLGTDSPLCGQPLAQSGLRVAAEQIGKPAKPVGADHAQRFHAVAARKDGDALLQAREIRRFT